MLTFARTRDFALVRALITAPESWDWATDDHAPAAGAFEANPDGRIYYVVATLPTNCIAFREVVSLYTLVPQNAACYEIHATRLFGPHVAAATREVFPWAFAHTPARRIVASIRSTNRLAIRAAKRAGMQQFGVNPRSFLKGGVLVDQVLLGIGPE